MDGRNTKYRSLDGDTSSTTIRTNTGSSMYDNDDMDIMEAETHQKSVQVKRASMARGHQGRGTARNKRQMTIYLIIIIVEVVILAGIWIAYGLSSGGSSSSKSESSQSSESSSGGSVNVENDKFTVACTKVSISTDTNGAPVAIIYFTYTNKTDNPLSMSQTYAPSATQNGVTLEANNSLVDTPMEIGNKDVQISNGDSLECAYAFSLQDSTSELTLIMHDNYETFSDIGSTVVPIS